MQAYQGYVNSINIIYTNNNASIKSDFDGGSINMVVTYYANNNTTTKTINIANSLTATLDSKGNIVTNYPYITTVVDPTNNYTNTERYYIGTNDTYNIPDVFATITSYTTLDDLLVAVKDTTFTNTDTINVIYLKSNNPTDSTVSVLANNLNNIEKITSTDIVKDAGYATKYDFLFRRFCSK